MLQLQNHILPVEDKILHHKDLLGDYDNYIHNIYIQITNIILRWIPNAPLYSLISMDLWLFQWVKNHNHTLTNGFAMFEE